MDRWIRGPIGAGADLRVTRPACRTALVVVPTVTAGTRLLDVVPLLETDHRVQTVFTVPQTHDSWHGVEEFVRAQHGLVLPWHQVLQHRFDLVLAASHRHLEELRGRILLIGHGAGTAKSHRYSRKAGAATIPATGLDRELLVYRGRILPSVLALNTDAELENVRSLCPEVVPFAVVTGDICLDRMRASAFLRERYRDRLGVAPGRRLVTLSSTWSTDSSFGQLPKLARAVLDALPPTRYAVAAVLHPNVWAVHGRRQVTAWLSDCVRDGLLLIPPESGWQATMIASDWVIGDHGSTTAYAAAIGCPITLAAHPGPGLREGSLADLVRRHAPALRNDRPLAEQENLALDARDRLTPVVSAAVSSRPGGAAAALRRAMYRLMELGEPRGRAEPAVLPAPVPCGVWP
ncbi:hypothetical protein SAMN04489730_4055 [Amycolatopsis australiensis]|uniref:CDP-Glycerol:Poly(Glycerophosphate) glycerophosphotransferase n=2 Tax=Amycolatopsis australiensis TaxID=546364 RepID=A0A1K1RW89_9PSEU|nr:hypothetical protein SAMN04489730_4055 [Amycolatopsis australiensis]